MNEVVTPHLDDKYKEYAAYIACTNDVTCMPDFLSRVAQWYYPFNAISLLHEYMNQYGISLK